jgi:poly(beta-D-mannuronate) C5 epimerase
MMLDRFNRLLTMIGLTLGAVFIFFHFHSAVASFGGKAEQGWKIVNGQVSTTALNKDYKVIIGQKNDAPDGRPALPDISVFTVDNIAARAPAYREGHVFIRSMAGLTGLREFVKKDGRIQRLRLNQVSVDPQAIVIQEGDYDLTHLYETVQKMAPDQAIRKEGNIYVLRMPILVGRYASLTISDKDAPEFRLSQDNSTFIANSGDLFILRTKIIGWNEKEKHASTFQDKGVYRPFLASWSGARLYIAGSTIASLGYRKGKSYGLTYSTCQYCEEDEPGLARPTGALVGNTFDDMYYGFYSYEADDVAIIGNVYSNNAVYGIDPHDRSRRLIIANNETYGSKKKHGIIISRNVDDSWIFNNYSHHNHGSGIMLDRSSRNNVIAENTAAYNDGDGITFYESENNWTFANRLHHNGLSGFRIRNSWNIRMQDDQITDNNGVPVVVYSQSLDGTGRDLKQDPYQQKAGAIMQGATVKLTDGKPVFKIERIENLVLSDISIVSAGKVFADNMFPIEADITANVGAHNKAIVVSRKEGAVE